MTINTNKDNGADDYPNWQSNPKLGSGVSDKKTMLPCSIGACLISPVIYLLVTNHVCH